MKQKKIIILSLFLLVVAAGVVVYNLAPSGREGEKVGYRPPYRQIEAGSIVLGEIVQGAQGLVVVPAQAKEVGVGLGVKKGKDNFLLTPVLEGVEGTPKMARKENTVIYEEVFAGVDVEYQLFDGHVKENIILKDAHSPRSFVFNLKKSFPDVVKIGMREEGGIFIHFFNEETGEELFSLDMPIAYDAKGYSIPYHYRVITEGEGTKVALEAHDPKDWNQEIAYPVVLDPPMTVREYDEVLVKIGQNGEGPGNAKDGDVVLIKPQGWPWGKEEYRDYVIVRVPKLTERERARFEESVRGESGIKREESPNDERVRAFDAAMAGVKYYGIDYTSMLLNPLVNALQRNSDSSETAIAKDGLLEVVRDRGKINPILDARVLPLNQIFTLKKWEPEVTKFKAGDTLIDPSILQDESVIPQERRLMTPVQEKKSRLTQLWERLIKPAFAQTTVTSSIGTASRDYSTTVAWEAAKNGDLVTLDQIQKGEMYNDSQFTDNLVIDGSTTDATRYMWLTVAAGNRHNGTAGTGVHIDPGSGTDVGIDISDDYTKVEWVDVHNSASYGIRSKNSGFNRINNVILRSNGNAGYTGWNDAGNKGTVITNSIAYSNTNQGFQLATASGYSDELYNCTAYGNTTTGVYAYNNTQIARNCISMGNTTASFGAGGTLTQSYNMSSDATASGTGSLTNKTASNQFVSLTGGSEDLHLKAGADAIDAGTDLSATFTNDIDDETRSGTWDMGADELLVTPSITSVTDTPDPTNPNRSVTFSIDWSDPQSGESVKAKVCKSSTLSAQNCTDEFWASSTAFTTSDPESLVYDIAGGDAGTTRNYFVHVCDDGGSCTSTSTAGTFSVNAVSTVPNVKIRGGTKFRGGTVR